MLLIPFPLTKHMACKVCNKHWLWSAPVFNLRAAYSYNAWLDEVADHLLTCKPMTYKRWEMISEGGE